MRYGGRASCSNDRHQAGRLCHHLHVRRLEVFGSAVSGEFDPARSDIDFVEFDPNHRNDVFGDYFALKEELEFLFGLSIDLIVERAMRNPNFRANVGRTRGPAYAT